MEAPVAIANQELETTIRPGFEGRPTVNTYTAKGKVEITLPGYDQPLSWFSMKGGAPGRKSGSFEVFYNTQTDEWLKVAYLGQDGSPNRINLLKASMPFAKTALEVAGLPRLAGQIKEYAIDSVRGLPAFGFTSPHLGVTLEQLNAMFRNNHQSTLTNDEVELFYRCYQIALKQSIELYSQYGFWMEDANPGNIILNKDVADEKVRVALIDVVNQKQIQTIDPKLQDYERKFTIDGHIGALKIIFEAQLAKVAGQKLRLTTH